MVSQRKSRRKKADSVERIIRKENEEGKQKSGEKICKKAIKFQNEAVKEGDVTDIGTSES